MIYKNVFQSLVIVYVVSVFLCVSLDNKSIVDKPNKLCRAAGLTLT